MISAIGGVVRRRSRPEIVLSAPPQGDAMNVIRSRPVGTTTLARPVWWSVFTMLMEDDSAARFRRVSWNTAASSSNPGPSAPGRWLPFAFEDHLEQLGELGLIVDHEDAGRHGRARSSCQRLSQAVCIRITRPSGYV
jgi:hypothetical protein